MSIPESSMIQHLQSLLYFIFIALVAGTALLLVAVQTAIIPGISLYIVSSGSMEPAISTGSVVFVVAQESYHVDDVITFGGESNNTIPTTHRIIGENIESGVLVYQTQGDANDDPDLTRVSVREIKGKVMLSIPFLGYILDFARQPLGFALIILVPALFIAFEEGMNIWREIRVRMKKKHDETNS